MPQKKLNVEISHEAALLISRNTSEGRKGVNLLADATGWPGIRSI